MGSVIGEILIKFVLRLPAGQDHVRQKNILLPAKTITGLVRSKCHIADFPDLIAQCKAGNEEAFRCIFDNYYQPIKHNISRFVSDAASAADILQDVFLALWEKKHTLSDDTDIEGWLFTVSYYKSVSFIRRSIKAAVELPEEGVKHTLQAVPESDPMEKENLYASQLHLLQEGIAQLSPQKKTAFILYKVKGRSYKEISQEMGISELSAKQYVKLSVQFLKQYVRSHELEISVFSYVLLAPMLTGQ
jgi:RNA polymerase sigma factor (sigma-70 family)